MKYLPLLGLLLFTGCSTAIQQPRRMPDVDIEFMIVQCHKIGKEPYGVYEPDSITGVAVTVEVKCE